jgi:hypothetical protein
MINGISETRAVFIGLLDDYFSRGLRLRKTPIWNEEEIMKRKFEEERTRVQPIYSSEGKLIEYDDSGRHLDFMA